MQADCSNYAKEINDLKAVLRQSQLKIEDLEKVVSMKGSYDQLITEMKEKAQHFERLLSNKTNKTDVRDAATSPIRQLNREAFRNQCVSTEDLPVEVLRSTSSASGSSTSDTRRIREEMAKMMAVQMKSLEKSFKDKLHQQEDTMRAMAIKLNQTQEVSKEREQDVAALKNCILSERKKFKEMMEQRDAEMKTMFEKQGQMLVKSRDELAKAKRRIDELNNELEKRNQKFVSERAKIEQMMEQWRMEKSKFVSQELDFQKKLDEAEKDRREIGEKYSKAKKTISVYKQYSDDKEKHIMKESERIQQAYRTEVKRVKDEMQNIIRNHERQTNQRIAQIQSKYESSLRSSESAPVIRQNSGNDTAGGRAAGRTAGRLATRVRTSSSSN